MAATCETRRASTKGALRPFMTIGCSGAACRILDDAFGSSFEREERASALLAGGILTSGYQCGQVWGAALAAGAEAHGRFGPGPAAERAAVAASRDLVVLFRDQNGRVDCVDLTGTDWRSRWQMLRYMLRGQSVRCYRMLKRFLPAAWDLISTELSRPRPGTCRGGPGCTARLAQRLGLSPEQTTMASGLAGGIGLTGGGCGALATAIWSVALADGDAAEAMDYSDPRARAVLDAFLVVTDYEFECSAIAGRPFADADDHAAYVEAGGCADILEALVEACPC